MNIVAVPHIAFHCKDLRMYTQHTIHATRHTAVVLTRLAATSPLHVLAAQDVISMCDDLDPAQRLYAGMRDVFLAHSERVHKVRHAALSQWYYELLSLLLCSRGEVWAGGTHIFPQILLHRDRSINTHSPWLHVLPLNRCWSRCLG